ncbi:helix-turn-helix domain-containing protein [Intestinirhabdus alba]|jgi:predicted transcriptional regulator|uniref:Helix-turn-helix domain-containing protein n=1 Tax=Intestinirhabdus alba TaxID=2899544 RepID=A0A6L6IH38_9ENTR|nr:helix-turn-helix domain-containing protein [Intestinirhabdus alba]MTH45395.1 helix-turn-helix domain-containing protein [Intestinirhabdus alba]
MNARDKIINYLETHKHASKKELHIATNLPINRIARVICDLTVSGQLELHSMNGKIKYYRLTELHWQRVSAVINYLGEARNSSAGEIADAIGLDRNTVTQILMSLAKQGTLYREWNGRSKMWFYSKSPSFIFGMGNPLTAFINQALREVRAQ